MAIDLSTPWVIAQAVPSPEIAHDREGSRFGLRWQVTPFSWSWGVNRRARRWSFFTVLPTRRHSGSTEISFDPEWLHHEGFLVRAAVRSYLPLVDRGEALSLSAASTLWTDGHAYGPGFEIALHTFSGFLGLAFSTATGLRGTTTAYTLVVRVL
ncbi:MAG: hypothetical protein ACXVEE_26650 [Polyangiales bacterium]